MIFLDAESRAILKEIAQLDSMRGVTRSETEILHGALKAAVVRARTEIMFMPVDKEEPKHSENKPESQSKAGYTRKGRRKILG